MFAINLSQSEKSDVQMFVENLQDAPIRDVDSLVGQFARGNHAAWQRFLLGTYNHPVTWWVGIFQLQMQMGIWGHHRQASATLRANSVARAFSVLTNDAANVIANGNSSLLSAILDFGKQIFPVACLAGALRTMQVRRAASGKDGYQDPQLPSDGRQISVLLVMAQALKQSRRGIGLSMPWFRLF